MQQDDQDAKVSATTGEDSIVPNTISNIGNNDMELNTANDGMDINLSASPNLSARSNSPRRRRASYEDESSIRSRSRSRSRGERSGRSLSRSRERRASHTDND